MVVASSLMATGAVAQSFDITRVQFSSGPDQIVQLKADKAIAYGADDRPLFNGTRAFILAAAGNASGRVYEWDLARGKVRVSAPGKPAAWLACSDLRDMSVACSTSLRIASDGGLVIAGRPSPGPNRGAQPPFSPATNAAGLPDCPGDPRCP